MELYGRTEWNGFRYACSATRIASLRRCNSWSRFSASLCTSSYCRRTSLRIRRTSSTAESSASAKASSVRSTMRRNSVLVRAPPLFTPQEELLEHAAGTQKPHTKPKTHTTVHKKTPQDHSFTDPTCNHYSCVIIMDMEIMLLLVYKKRNKTTKHENETTTGPMDVAGKLSIFQSAVRDTYRRKTPTPPRTPPWEIISSLRGPRTWQ